MTGVQKELHMSDGELWKWYEIIQDFCKSKLPQKPYCTKNKINYSKLHNMYRRIAYISIAKPDKYEKLLPIAREYMQSATTPKEFAKNHGISALSLIEMSLHLKYLDRIEYLKSQKNPDSMKFIEVHKGSWRTNIPSSNGKSPLIEPEVVAKKNDIELIISKGVKVIVSPEIGADKLVRIIELLKDL